MIPREWRTAIREPRWRALAGAFLTVVLAQGLSNSFPVFLLPISADLGGLRSLSAAVFSAHNLVMGLVGTVVDALMRRFGERPVMLAGAVILGGGVALAATADSLWASSCGSAASPVWGLGSWAASPSWSS